MDGRTNEQTNNAVSRVAFATEKLWLYPSFFSTPVDPRTTGFAKQMDGNGGIRLIVCRLDTIFSQGDHSQTYSPQLTQS